MKYSDLIEQVKTESRIQADASFQPLVVKLLNELFIEATLSERPFELKQETAIVLTTAQRLVNLPTDFLVHHELLFKDADSGRIYPLSDEDDAAQPAPRGLYGHPKTFEIITGNQAFLKPYDMIVGNDTLYLVYYKKPPVILEADLNTENPITRLEPFLIRAAIQRVRMFHTSDPAVIQMLNGPIASAGKAFAKDEPVPMKKDMRQQQQQEA